MKGAGASRYRKKALTFPDEQLLEWVKGPLPQFRLNLPSVSQVAEVEIFDPE